MLKAQRQASLVIISEVDDREMDGCLIDDDCARQQQAQVDFGCVAYMKEISF